MVILPFIIATTHWVISVEQSIGKGLADPEGLVEGSTALFKIESC